MNRIVRWEVEEGHFWHTAFGPNGERIAMVSRGGVLRIGKTERHFDTMASAKEAANEFFSGGSSKVKDVLQDMKGFIHDNRNIIYWLALAFLADHFFFSGKFRERLHGMVEKLIGRAEAKIEAVK